LIHSEIRTAEPVGEDIRVAPHVLLGAFLYGHIPELCIEDAEKGVSDFQAYLATDERLIPLEMSKSIAQVTTSLVSVTDPANDVRIT